jgi:hypothetical protein
MCFIHARIHGFMDERDSITQAGYEDPEFKKMRKWSLKKLEKKHDQHRGMITATRSTIKRFERLRSKYVEDCAKLLEEEKNQHSVEAYIAELEQKRRIVELTTLDRQILATINDLKREKQLLHEHNRTAEFLLKLIKDKSI